MAERLQCAAYDRADRMADDCELNAVIVCTPPVTHPEVCAYLLERKINVLCEKPLSIDSRQAVLMLETALTNNVKLTMASKFRYVDDIVRAKNMVVAGVLGELVLFENVFASRVDMTSRWNAIPAISGGGVLIDNGTHSVDLMRYFLGPLAEVHVLEGKRCQGLPVEETVAVFVRSVAGVLGSIDLSWSISKQRETYLDIYGSLGAISIGWKESKHLDYAKGDWVVFGQGYDKIKAFRSQIKNFSRAIRGEEQLLITEEDALASVYVVQAAYQALHDHHWTQVAVETLQVGSGTYGCNANGSPGTPSARLSHRGYQDPQPPPLH
jgi:predicted dehydrogenase